MQPPTTTLVPRINAAIISSGILPIVIGLNLSPQSCMATAQVWADYGAESPILDIRLFEQATPHPSHVAITPIVIPAGPAAQGSGQATGSYDVHHGLIKLTAAMTALADDPLAPGLNREHQSAFNGGFQDIVTITNSPPLPVGTPLVIAPVMAIHSLFTLSASGVIPVPNSDASFASPSYSVQVAFDKGPSYGGVVEHQKWKSCFLSAAGPPDFCPTNLTETWVLPTLTVPYGVPFDLTVNAQAGVSLRTPPGGSAAAGSDLGAMISWLGMVVVALTNGMVLTNCTFTAESGFDYGVRLQPANNPPPTLALDASDPEILKICWSAAPLQVYQLQASTNLASGIWLAEGELLVGTGEQLCIEQNPAGLQRFYRVWCVPNP